MAADANNLPVVGVVAATGPLRERLVEALGGRLRVGCAVAPERLPSVADRLPRLDAWVACLAPDGTSDACLDVLWNDPDTPVFISDLLPDDSRGLALFCARVADKVTGLGQPALMPAAVPATAGSESPAGQPEPPPVAPLWVLAASLGGPNAVRQFLQALTEPPPVALLYAQHIDRGFEPSLARLVCRGSPVQPVLEPDGPLPAGHLAVVPVERQLAVLPDGALRILDKPWAGAYAPDIGAVVSRVATVFGPASGAVFFTGMGDDGAMVAARASKLGLALWAQAPASCASPVMPEALLATGACSGQGTPVQLVNALAPAWARMRKSA